MIQTNDSEFCQELLLKLLSQYPLQISFSNLNIDLAQIMEQRCFQALKEIKMVLNDFTLSDAECFMKIEAIIGILEENGSSAGERHDFI